MHVGRTLPVSVASLVATHQQVGREVLAGRWTMVRSTGWFMLKAVVNTIIKVVLPAAIIAALAYYKRDAIIQWFQQAKH